jgi:hypothetical protein
VFKKLEVFAEGSKAYQIIQVWRKVRSDWFEEHIKTRYQGRYNSWVRMCAFGQLRESERSREENWFINGNKTVFNATRE